MTRRYTVADLANVVGVVGGPDLARRARRIVRRAGCRVVRAGRAAGGGVVETRARLSAAGLWAAAAVLSLVGVGVAVGRAGQGVASELTRPRRVRRRTGRRVRPAWTPETVAVGPAAVPTPHAGGDVLAVDLTAVDLPCTRDGYPHPTAADLAPAGRPIGYDPAETDELRRAVETARATASKPARKPATRTRKPTTVKPAPAPVATVKPARTRAASKPATVKPAPAAKPARKPTPRKLHPVPMPSANQETAAPAVKPARTRKPAAVKPAVVKPAARKGKPAAV